MTAITGIMVLHHEGQLARAALLSLKRVANPVFVIHDGPADAETKKTAEDLDVIFIEKNKLGCKEAQLTNFLGNYFSKEDPSINDWIINTDSDEVLSEALINEILSLKLNKLGCYWVEMAHICQDEVVLKYAKNSVRIMKAILFNIDSVHSIIGLPHKGVQSSKNNKFLSGHLLHRARHLNYSFFKIFKKEMKFAIKDAKLRAKPVEIFINKKLVSVSGGDCILPLTDRLRFKFPLLMALPSAIYSLIISLQGLVDVRSARTFICESRLVCTRPFYQVYLCYLIYVNKIIQSRLRDEK